MPSFSQRIGVKPIRVEIQKESADSDLRNELWNAIYLSYFENIDYHMYKLLPEKRKLLQLIWMYYLKKPFDDLPNSTGSIVTSIKKIILDGQWNELYDILEFIPDYYEVDDYSNENKDFIAWCNNILEKHLSAYRFVDRYIAEVTSTEEINSIKDAVNDTSTATPVITHLRRALELFSNRNDPDYRNSIKESISAVESYCKILTNDNKATLGKALATIERNHDLHGSLKSAFTALYGYTSDAAGIRHALLDESDLRQEDAKFLLVTCSAFINYLTIKNNS